MLTAVRSPQSAVRSPQSAVRSPQTADRRPQTADRRPQTADRQPTANYRNRSGISAITYVMTAMAAEACETSSGSILSTVSAAVWWIRK